MKSNVFAKLSTQIEHCQACPRLLSHCKEISQVKRKSYQHESYWGRPVPGWGDPQAELIVVGLAPAAHGANRTGRMFTGDRSGEWLYRALHKAGFANQAESTHRDDGLILKNTYITAVGRCAPPDNKPLPEELANCAPFLKREIQELKRARVFIALGQIALGGLWPHLQVYAKSRVKRPLFKHGCVIELGDGRWLILSYHPSQQNTFTGRLTEPMFDEVFARARDCFRP